MCGICGKFDFRREGSVSPTLVKSMADAIVHRGPDDEGFYVNGAIGLGFRRLSIIDLNTGHQPISNEDGTIWVVFNGEIYNYGALRSELVSKGHVFRTKTDTEVLVHLYEEHGPALLPKLRGMFAFAIWDSLNQELLLARDRVGIKPLYYSLTARSLSFASEIKALLVDPEIEREIDARVIDRFLSFHYTPGEETLFKGVSKLPPGSYLIASGRKTEIHRYWDLSFERPQPSVDERAAGEQLVALLEESLQLHMISDVPVGFLLSGGVDSTAMLSFATSKTNRRLSSFTVGFSGSDVVDERPYARLAAQKFDTEHHELSISAREFADFLPKYVWHMEEPVCEPPAVALYYVTQLARDFVKVLISGEGGDEAFAGYSNYRNLVWLERMKRGLGPARHVVSKALALAEQLGMSPRFGKYAPLMSSSLSDTYLSRTSSPFSHLNRNAQQLYSSEFRSHCNKAWSTAPAREFFSSADRSSDLSAMLYVDTKSWLPDDLLVKADKMTMANSVELRVPFLDHEVLEFAAALPPHLKLRGFTTKYLAKKALKNRVPPEILSRRKAGFPVPYETWIRKDLNALFHDLLLDPRSLQRGYFRKSFLRDLLSANRKSGAYSKEIFSLAVLELWHRVFADIPSSRHDSLSSMQGHEPARPLPAVSL